MNSPAVRHSNKASTKPARRVMAWRSCRIPMAQSMAGITTYRIIWATIVWLSKKTAR